MSASALVDYIWPLQYHPWVGQLLSLPYQLQWAKLEDKGPGSDAAVCARGSVATSVDGAAVAGHTDCNISRISVISRQRSATAASDAVSCC